jgi:WD40 repeat protein
MLAAASEDHTLSVHAITNNEFKSIPVEQSHSSAVTNVAFACNGTRLISTGADRQIVFRTVSNTEITKLNATTVGEGTAAVSIKVHPTQKFAVSCGAEKQMQVLINAASKFDQYLLC